MFGKRISQQSWSFCGPEKTRFYSKMILKASQHEGFCAFLQQIKEKFRRGFDGPNYMQFHFLKFLVNRFDSSVKFIAQFNNLCFSLLF